MYEFVVTVIGEVMMCFGAFGLGWYLRRPPTFGRMIGVVGRRCSDA